MPTDKRQRQKEGRYARREAALAAARRQQRKRRLIMSAVIAVVVLGIVFLISTVGGNDDNTDTSTTAKPPTTMPAPKVTIPSDRAPTELETKDLTVGKGRVVKLGDTIEVNYLGMQLKDGKTFDSTWRNGRLGTYQLVEGGLIKAWTDGIPGMRVGGRRQLIVPASLAYGDSNPSGGPSGPLLFIVDVVAVK